VNIQRAHERTLNRNCSEGGFGSLRGDPLDISGCLEVTGGEYAKSTRAHTQKELIRGGGGGGGGGRGGGGGGGGLSERARVRRHYGPLCSTLVATKSGSFCITVVSVSGVIIVLRSQKHINTALTLALAQTIFYK